MHSEVFVFFLLKALLILSVEGSTTVKEKVPVQKEHLVGPIPKSLSNQSPDGAIQKNISESLNNQSNILLAEVDNKTAITVDANNSKSSTLQTSLPTNTSTLGSTTSVTVIPINITTAANKNYTTPSSTVDPLHLNTTVFTKPPSVTPADNFSSTMPSTTSKILDNSTPLPQSRQFDGPSFIGGIVLTVGLTAIGFIAFKFYKADRAAKSENYRKL